MSSGNVGLSGLLGVGYWLLPHPDPCQIYPKIQRQKTDVKWREIHVRHGGHFPLHDHFIRIFHLGLETLRGCNFPTIQIFSTYSRIRVAPARDHQRHLESVEDQIRGGRSEGIKSGNFGHRRFHLAHFEGARGKQWPRIGESSVTRSAEIVG